MGASNPPGGGRVGAGASVPPPGSAEGPEQIARRLERLRGRAPGLVACLEFTMYLSPKTGLPALKEVEDILARLEERLVPPLTPSSPSMRPGSTPSLRPTSSGSMPAVRVTTSQPPTRSSQRAPAVSIRPARTAVSMRVSGGDNSLLVVGLAFLIAAEVVGLLWMWLRA